MPSRRAHARGHRDGSGSPTASRIAPSPPLSARMWPRSEESPSEMSIMAWIGAALVQGQGLGDPRLGPEVAAGEQAAAERAGDQDRVARPGARAPDGAPRGRFAEHGDVMTSGPSQALVSPPTRSTPNRSASSPHPGMKTLGHRDRAFSRQGDGDDGGAGNARHRRDVRQVHAHRLVADRLGAVLLELEMAAVHQHVGRDQEVGAAPARRRPGSRSRRRCRAGSRSPAAPARGGGSSRSGRIRRLHPFHPSSPCSSLSPPSGRSPHTASMIPDASSRAPILAAVVGGRRPAARDGWPASSSPGFFRKIGARRPPGLSYTLGWAMRRIPGGDRTWQAEHWDRA